MLAATSVSVPESAQLYVHISYYSILYCKEKKNCSSERNIPAFKNAVILNILEYIYPRWSVKKAVLLNVNNFPNFLI